MDISVLLASLGISVLELSEASAVAVIFQGIYKNFKPILYAIAGILLVLLPVFLLGRYIVFLPIEYVLLAAAVILAYFGYRLLASARRSFKGIRRKHEEKEEGIITVFVVSATEALEAGLVILALIPQSFSSTLLGTLIAVVVVIALTIALRAQIMKIRVPHLKFVLSALLFGLATLFMGEALLNIDEVFLPVFFAVFLGVNYALIKL
ncbi:hypothetical protein BFU36_06915 [Sulfolobus sp. A20]|uniref:hypothetical protein n=1 Tax=Sulfolobaceae TaxID=118883 RepID=UPI000845E551|nr:MULTISPECIES: hypothetical protein [unclassified Sulfolobus]TRM75230.1 hypothetical protein DJ532_10790 [Sulfolobus sp. A20-N-F8]TRM78998.1 hypothetical protein DJ528_03160 [Sulfolobus sp. B5]TRM82059.1 hypothetical protein DJ524_01985 [Sulfolobus sp. D5]TRM83585.1 hypothetical protein DJ531_04900 [Sulfolobus sp. A20-N-F6]TRM88151.1 hypothetical protein DJ521_02410 [Sulfolobus sp. E3]TRM88332.1 hypothetical protein DJ529_05670 [Sulfolobus sp. C3]TRM95304.1 hypothetical protein DJ526_00710